MKCNEYIMRECKNARMQEFGSKQIDYTELEVQSTVLLVENKMIMHLLVWL